jgi:hypothetical protein
MKNEIQSMEQNPQSQASAPVAEKQVFDVSLEARQRLHILSALYRQRHDDEDHPSLTSRELELKIGVARGSLNFALWYLKNKGLITREDSCACGISAEGVDFFEEQALKGRVSGFVATQEEPSSEQTSVGAHLVAIQLPGLLN